METWDFVKPRFSMISVAVVNWGLLARNRRILNHFIQKGGDCQVILFEIAILDRLLYNCNKTYNDIKWTIK